MRRVTIIFPLHRGVSQCDFRALWVLVSPTLHIVEGLFPRVESGGVKKIGFTDESEVGARRYEVTRVPSNFQRAAVARHRLARSACHRKGPRWRVLRFESLLPAEVALTRRVAGKRGGGAAAREREVRRWVEDTVWSAAHGLRSLCRAQPQRADGAPQARVRRAEDERLVRAAPHHVGPTRATAAVVSPHACCPPQLHGRRGGEAHRAGRLLAYHQGQRV